jgi:MFS family permease
MSTGEPRPEVTAAMLEPAPGALVLPVALLGMTQIIAWGSLFYAIAVLAQPMADTLGIGTTGVFGAFSASLAISGLTAPAIGRALDRFGGYRIMAAGSAISAVALMLIASAQGPVQFFIGWGLAGVAMAANLYDAAFPALSQFAGRHYRSALTALTLLGGLASTVFWPLAWWLHEAFDWRTAMALFAGLHLLVCLPAHYLGLPRPLAPTAAGDPQELLTPPPPAAGGRFLWLVTAFTLSAFVVSGTAAHAVGAIKASGLSPATAILAVSLIGPMQVVGRIIEFVFARGVVATAVGLVTFAVMAVAMCLLLLIGLSPAMAFAFACAYGLSNGVMSIVRGTVPAELFGRHAYGTLMGRLAGPAFFAKAAAPVTLAALVAGGNHYGWLAALLALLSVLALLAFVAAVRGHRAS